ncbi:MAG TPA: hypothetical protein VFE58_18195 [Tepidisphaeraceae bacterium]|jgi:hypothetical protein|nr:hypothetical protein [Tepidisphaeraceae bacterium]
MPDRLKWFHLALLPVMITFCCAAAPAGPASDLASEFAPLLKNARYMESGPATPVTIPGWEGFPTLRYTYSVHDHDGAIKSADVVLLDPSAEQISRWIVHSLTEVKGSYDPADGRKIFHHILEQSGGQFPVTGIVYEDIIPADGVNEIYCFRDGVTVEIEGVPHRGTAPLTPAQIQSSLTGKVIRVFRYARIQSTSPEMWTAFTGDTAVLSDDKKPTPHWQDVIRHEYQNAWGKDENQLMTAWVKANMK